MKFPLMTVLVITDEPKKWAHEVLKFLNGKARNPTGFRRWDEWR